MMFTGCYSLTASPLIHCNRPNRVFLSRRSVGQLCLRTTAPRRGCIRSSSFDGALVIDEKAVAKDIFGEVRRQVSRMKKSMGAVPQLAVVRVGDGNKKNPDTYVLLCEIVGMKAFLVALPETCSEEEVLECVSRLNHDPCVHGILVQLPLPSHVDEHNILTAVSLEKDVQGVHPLTIGRLAMMQGGEPLFVPPAPKGCIELLHHYNFEIKGKRAVVLGRSNNFGMPAALLLQREDATVTIIHSKTNNPEEITRQADIVISAVGQPNMVRGSWIKPGAVVINVGRSLVWPNEIPLVFDGDICYEEVCNVASAITPVSGRLYSITLAMLLSNILASAKRFHHVGAPKPVTAALLNNGEDDQSLERLQQEVKIADECLQEAMFIKKAIRDGMPSRE